jgi:hypothetical protein
VITPAEHAAALRELADVEPYLLEHSGLPGPRGNLELAAVAARELPAAQLRRWAMLDADAAPTGEAREFLAFCGVLGYGAQLCEGDGGALAALRDHAGDARWRVREAVAMALQWWGGRDFDALVAAMRAWAGGSPLERRAAAAALCEPALLSGEARVRATFDVLEEATEAITATERSDRRAADYQALRKGLGYCWSVAAAAAFGAGRPRLEALVARAADTGDRDLAWVARENLRKKRLERIDAAWVAEQRARLA